MFPALAVAVAAPRRPTDEESDPQDPLAGHPLVEELRAGPHRGFTAEVRRLVLVRDMWLAVPLLGESLDWPTVGFSLAVMATVIVSKRSAAARGR